MPGACLCQGARHPPTLPTFVASQSIPVTKEASNLTLTSQWTRVSLLCHYFQWGIFGGEPLATISILNIHSGYSHKSPAFLTPGFATKSPQSINALSFYHLQTSGCILFLKMHFRERISPQKVTGPGISMSIQPSLPTQQKISLLVSSCFLIILRDFSDHILLPLSFKKYPTSFYPFLLVVEGG